MKSFNVALIAALSSLSMLTSCQPGFKSQIITSDNIIVYTYSDFAHPSGDASIFKEENDDGTYSVGVSIPLTGRPDGITFSSSSILEVFDVNGHEIGLALCENNNPSIISGLNSTENDYSLLFSFPLHWKSDLIDELITSSGKIELDIYNISSRDSVEIIRGDKVTKIFEAESLGAWKYQEKMDNGIGQESGFVVRNPVAASTFNDFSLLEDVVEVMLVISVTIEDEDVEPVVQLSLSSRYDYPSSQLSSERTRNLAYSISFLNSGNTYSIKRESDSNGKINIEGKDALDLLDLLSSQTKTTIKFVHSSKKFFSSKEYIFEVNNDPGLNAVYNYMLGKLSQKHTIL